MARTRFASILCFPRVAHQASCHILSTAFLKPMKTRHRFWVLFKQDSEVVDLFYGASCGSQPSLPFSDNLFSLEFDPVQNYFQHDFTRMTDETDGSVVLAEL